MNRDQRLLALAFKATYSSLHRMPTAAVIAVNGKPISVGINKPNCTHPKQDDAHYPGQHATSTHAELSAILGVPREQLERSSIYVARRLRSSCKPGLAKPCSTCARLIKEAGIKRVIYTTNETAIISKLQQS